MFFLLPFHRPIDYTEADFSKGLTVSGIVNYEVYAYQNGSWDLIGRYPSERRAAAMEHAKSVEFSQQKPTKVVKETYDMDAQLFTEAMVYLSDLPKPPPRDKFIGKAAPPIPKYTQSTSRKRRQSFTEAFLRLGGALIASLLGSGALSAAILRAMVLGNFAPTDMPQHFALGLFVFFFLFLSIPLAVRWVDWNVLMGVDEEDELLRRQPKTEQEIREKAFKPTETQTEKIEKVDAFSAGIVRLLFNWYDRITGRKPLTEQGQEQPAPAPEEEAADVQTETPPAADESPASDAETPEAPESSDAADAEAKPADSSVDAELPDIPVSESVLPPALNKYNLQLTAFLSLTLKVLQKQNALLNTYARFGVELFLAGACEFLCTKNTLTKDDNRLLLASLLELMGRSKPLADLFYDRLDEYMLEPTYLPMIENGEKAMELYTETPNSPELLSLLQGALQKWLNPDKKETPQSGIISIMFTDIVGSTQMTQTYGDKLAQELVHRHNTIVRQALTACNGEEIKQTGDGIMASFVWASNALDAAIAIQRAVDDYNRQSPTVPLDIRIGLNAGEPIVENNDLFGLTVQLASRICGQADKDQIFVSSVIKELAAGKNYTFNDLGLFDLKGIDDKQRLYEVVWQKPKKKNTPPRKAEEHVPVEKNLDEVLPEL